MVLQDREGSIPSFVAGQGDWGRWILPAPPVTCHGVSAVAVIDSDGWTISHNSSNEPDSGRLPGRIVDGNRKDRFRISSIRFPAPNRLNPKRDFSLSTE